MLSGRRNQYKKAALAAKKKGDMAMATKYAKTAKQFDRVLEAVASGNPVDLSQMPPPPPGFEGMNFSQYSEEVNNGTDGPLNIIILIALQSAILSFSIK